MTAPSEVTFTSESATFHSDGVACAATIYRPKRASGAPAPVIVMAHGFGAVRVLRLPAYAERFAAAGYVVLTFDYRGFGDSAGEPRQVLDIKMQHDDWRAALDFARRLDGVDADRVVAWGTSFAGGHVLTLAGRGEQLAAVIAQVPHVSGPAAVRATGLAASARLVPFALRDVVRAARGRDPIYIASAGAPGAVAAMTSPDALPGSEALRIESGLRTGDYPEEVAARIILKIGSYSPHRVAADIDCPVLVQIAERDAITPAAVATKAARKIKRSTIHTYDCGHFDPYVGPTFDRVVADQLTFLATHVPVTPHTAK